MDKQQLASKLLKQFKGDDYIFGPGCIEQIGKTVIRYGQSVAFIHAEFPGYDDFTVRIEQSLSEAGVSMVGRIEGAAPNAPREDLARVTDQLHMCRPEVVLSFGGGSTIDCAKAANVLLCLGGSIDDYFGVGLVTEQLQSTCKQLLPHIAVETAASSAAHLTKYSNITDVTTGQKKLIVDEAIVPPTALFDYAVTHKAPAALTLDGALDGISHCLEVLYGAVGKDNYSTIAEVAQCCISLVVENLPKVMKNDTDSLARDTLCLATDLGGYAIMLGGTNGGHLTSFSLVDILSHGRACAMMNPYYTVFFAPAVEEPLRLVGDIYKTHGYTDVDLAALQGRDLGLAVAEAMLTFARKIGFPQTLSEVPGFTEGHIDRALEAAKNPQLKMKLQNMPIPLTAETVDEFMGPILQAANTGDLSMILCR